jgi:hypothetical protein
MLKEDWTEHVQWIAENRVESELVARFGRCGEELILEVPNTCLLLGDRRGEKVEFFPLRELDPDMDMKLRCGLLRAFTRHLRGKLSLHVAAVSFAGRALSVVGPSRSGKSTLAAALCRRRGVELLADDSIAVETVPDSDSVPVRVAPTERTNWLLPDARQALRAPTLSTTLKRPVDPPRAASSELPAGHFVVLKFESDGVPALRPLSKTAALAKLLPLMTRFLVDDLEARQCEFRNITNLLANCRFYELSRKADLMDLERCVDLVLQLAESEP